MKTRVLVLGSRRLDCLIAETPLEQATGLEGHAFLHDWQGMYFPMFPARRAVFAMAGVPFPIDILFFRAGHLAKAISNVPPGHPGRWSFEPCSGVLEVRGGWTLDHGIKVGAPLLGSL